MEKKFTVPILTDGIFTHRAAADIKARAKLAADDAVAPLKEQAASAAQSAAEAQKKFEGLAARVAAVESSPGSAVKAADNGNGTVTLTL